uniref:Angel homolog 1 (Drosophila) n=1 Tax=Oryzias latipes TaxID=8090 RepID=A0A3P9HAB5_ORYLA
MIGNLLFHVLYPFSRYINSRLAETSGNAVTPAVVKGTADWDGASLTVSLLPSQTTLLHHSGETKKRVEKEKKHALNTDMESHEGPRQDADSEITVLQRDAGNPNEDSDKKQDSEDGCSSTVDGAGLEAEQLKSLQTQSHVQEEKLTTVEQIQIQTSQSPAGSSEHSCSADGQLHTSSKKNLQTLAETVSEISECWDEYTLLSGEERYNTASAPQLTQSSLPSGTQAHLQRVEEEQTCWHFPHGPGLTQEIQCKPWEFPALSYYLPVEPAEQLEVIWRVWKELSDCNAAAELIPFPFSDGSMDFTVMSYNILAPDLLELNQYLYKHCPLEVLDWNYRYNLLVEEIKKWTPDILCLQEVQENHYREQLHPALIEMGYSCIYKCRTGTKTDGCAVCYRSKRFAEVSFTKLEFFRPETGLLNRHNVGIVLLLRPLVAQGAALKESGPLLCLANTHLLFNPRRGDVKLAQLAIMLAEIDAVVKSCKVKGEHCNVVLCGDFNSLPNTPLYQLIVTGELYYQGLPAWMVSGQEDLSYKPSCHRLSAPLLPGSLGITDSCQYTSVNSLKAGKCRYSHDFMLQLRFCPAACSRPPDLVLIPGVTDLAPDASKPNHYPQRFRDILQHQLNLESVYKHVCPDVDRPEVTTLHSEVGATVDYIFYTQKRTCASHQKPGEKFPGEGLKLTGYLSLLPEDVLWSMNGLPNQIFPSDHLSLLARFQLDLNSS